MWICERDIKMGIKIITYEEHHTLCYSSNNNNNKRGYEKCIKILVQKSESMK